MFAVARIARERHLPGRAPSFQCYKSDKHRFGQSYPERGPGANGVWSAMSARSAKMDLARGEANPRRLRIVNPIWTFDLLRFMLATPSCIRRRSVNEVDWIGAAVLNVRRRTFPNDAITHINSFVAVSEAVTNTAVSVIPIQNVKANRSGGRQSRRDRQLSNPDLPAEKIFESLAAARWEVAHRTYGSSHATLIGILVDWWISLDLESHTAFDGAASHGKGNLGQGDALFCRGQKPMGVLEAEGTNPVAKVASIVKYFETGRTELQSVWFGVLLLYSYEARGSGARRQHRPAEDSAILELARKATEEHPTGAIIVITVDKQFMRFTEGVRSQSGYYSGTTSKVTGILFRTGKEDRRQTLFDTQV